MPKLDEWKIVVVLPSEYSAPEEGKAVISGKIYDDDRFNDGEHITSSTLKEYNAKQKTARTKNTKYELANPCKNWTEWLEKQGYSLEDFNFNENS